MNQNKAPLLFSALAVIAIAVVAAVIAGASVNQLAIMLACSLVLTFMALYQDAERVVPPADLKPRPATDLIDQPGFQNVLQGLDAPVLIVETGKIIAANSPATRLLGGHILGEDVRIAIRHPAAAERLTDSASITAPLRIDIVGLGTRAQRWAMRIIPLDQRADLKRLFVILEDVSDLHAAERARGDFVANASHELRTPLAAILGFVETLQDDNAGGDPQTRQRFLSIIENEAKRMRQLVDDLMSLSRIEADKHRLPTEHIALPDLIAEVVAVSRQNLGPRGADIQSDIQADLPLISGDRTQIGQVLHNLLSNSAKYGRAGTPIVIHARPVEPAMVRLEVSDEGEGVPPDHLPRLTERFYRVDSGRSRALGGTGLGLAIVKHIVERHRGRLDISSTPGKGTRVSVLLPRAETEAARTGYAL